jgi:hypothetical protein
LCPTQATLTTPRVEDALRSLAGRLATAGDPFTSDAWLSVARATRYQCGRRDDTLSALIEALYWGRGNDHAWSELVDYASAAPASGHPVRGPG